MAEVESDEFVRVYIVSAGRGACVCQPDPTAEGGRRQLRRGVAVFQPRVPAAPVDPWGRVCGLTWDREFPLRDGSGEVFETGAGVCGKGRRGWEEGEGDEGVGD